MDASVVGSRKLRHCPFSHHPRGGINDYNRCKIVALTLKRSESSSNLNQFIMSTVLGNLVFWLVILMGSSCAGVFKAMHESAVKFLLKEKLNA